MAKSKGKGAGSGANGRNDVLWEPGRYRKT
jgi:hypothetical protein